ncbi:hypothetical protein K469DRAFT_695856 [Zopfia rhizophila CBS 207.26]|uniref:Protein kinase domain-containing protein n=1 Tax=Zopfia rhizophila CBS 207.26 TaxID=1314779 RepID=A0A6A6EI27_9PEZI|nr:hypothetical protein K469DRAFT_695856 [Zopfia rhizophila CBS 207.26]
MHGDIKPGNIGVQLPRTGPLTLDELRKESRVVFLDLDGASNLATLPERRLPPKPGYGGIVGYLAPERELEHRSFDNDVWAMGVTGYELRYGSHPWKFAQNPWRPDRPDHLRREWKSRYDSAIAGIQKALHPQSNELLLMMLSVINTGLVLLILLMKA